MEIIGDSKYNLSDVVEIEHISRVGIKHERIGPILAIRITIQDTGETTYEYHVKERFFPEESIVGHFVRKA